MKTSQSMEDAAKTHEELLAELEQYHRLLDNIPAELGVLDAQGRFLFNTPSGIRDAEMRAWVIGKTHHEYAIRRGLPDAFADNRQRQLDRCIERQKTIYFEESITDKTGKVRHYLRMFTPVLNAKSEVTHVIGHGQEITQRKQAEENLQQLRRQNELILNSVGEGIYGLDLDGNTTFVNPTAAHILGWQPQDLLGRPQHDLIHHTRPDGSKYPREECPIYCALKDGQVHTVNNELFWRKDGTSVPVEYTSTPIRDEDDKLVGAVVVFEDITQRKEAEQALRNALEQIQQLKNRLQAENVYLREEIKLQHNFEEIVTRGKALKKVLNQVEQVASTDATVLILGETGTGKELIARAVHVISPRKDRPLVKVNCAALPANLIESELFGHEKGAFTGALSRKQGRFELADQGTIFLDEIGDLPLDLQAKLLRVLQEGEFERLGGTSTLKVDVRVIAATNRSLVKLVEDGEFREDLYYRLNVFPVTVPPLRDRKDDIPLLVKHFLTKYSAKIGKEIDQVSEGIMERLQAYDWPGNVRELENIVERALIISVGPQLEIGDWLPKSDARLRKGEDVADRLGVGTLEELERNHILAVLERTGWRVRGNDGAAKILDINPSTLESRMKKLGIKRPLPAI